eukprot:scaffold8924_cov106-Skeletonema_dohrnii-CCMP3373.AAC.2
MFNDRNDALNEDDEEDNERWLADLQGIKENNPETTELERNGEYTYVHNIADEGWEELGQDIASNTHLKDLHLYERALNIMLCLFRRLTRSSSSTKPFSSPSTQPIVVILVVIGRE